MELNMKLNMKLILKLIYISIIIAVMIQLLKTRYTSCEELVMSKEEALSSLKEIVYNGLYEFVRQEHFKKAYGDTWIYSNWILKEEFIKSFIEKFNWDEFFSKNDNMTGQTLIHKICEIFISYVNEMITNFNKACFKKQELAYVKSIGFFNEFITQPVVSVIKDWLYLIPWFICVGIMYQFWLQQPSDSVIDNMPNFIETIGYSLQSCGDALRTIMPHLKQPIQENAVIPFNNFHFINCITKETWYIFFNNSDEWKEIVSHNHKPLTIIFIIVIVIICKVVASE